jgi:UDP-N-acetylmuramoylalanine--D-glutamate ligase
MQIEGRKALVLGAGKSGVESARFLAERGASVTLHDKKAIEEWSDAARELANLSNVQSISGEIRLSVIDSIDLVVISPGVPVSTIPAELRDREIIGEVELAYRFLKGHIVGITGSNGKTTTTALIGEMLKDAGYETRVGGNIGTPLLTLTEASTDETWTVVELSSFQLETIEDFRPDVGICLNVTPNHLDRYDSFQDYAKAKRRLFMNQRSSDTAILNADDGVTASWPNDLRSRSVMFSVKNELNEGLFLRERELVCRADGGQKILISRDDIFLQGLHNVENILAAFGAGLACGASVESMRETVKEFKGVEHRIEFVAEIGGVEFYNDSKATSVDATSKALEALSGNEGKTVLILGGRGKNAPYEPLVGLIESSARALILIGEDADNIESQLRGHAEIIRADSLEEAVRKGFDAAVKGDAVLLAPACASFDMFRSFEERGEVFKAAVRRLGETAAGTGI